MARRHALSCTNPEDVAVADLHLLDWIVIALYLVLTLTLGLLFSRRASRSSQEYFLAGRSLPWWVLGTSMVATTFAADTPLAVTGFVRHDGIWYNWFGWHYVLSQTMAVFLFSRFWRRAEVVTDNELIELRYAGRPAALLRGFKAVYFAVLYNFIVLGWVLKGMATVAQTVLGIPSTVAVVGGAALALSYSLMAGFWGVVVTDVVQFVLAMAGSITLAVVAVGRVGGIAELQAKLAASPLVHPDTLAFIPGHANFGKFLIFVTVMWWASHNADGGGYLIQRMAAARNERHARGATLWYAVAVNAVRYWPWIVVALCSLVLVPNMPAGMSDEAAYPQVMAMVLGPGLLGMMLVSFLAAFMSTVDTHLNWGASYLVNDVYRRFVRPQAGEHEAVAAAKVAVAVLMSLAVLVAYSLQSIGKAWLFVWAMGAGIGPVLILRWFWWRINAWSEIAALAASVVGAVGFEVAAGIQAGRAYQLFSSPLHLHGMVLQTHHKVLILVPFTLVVWLTATFLTQPEPIARLSGFYRRVRPGGAWGPVAAACPEVRCDGLSWGIVGVWLAGVVMVYGILFGIGKLVLGSTGAGLGLLAIAAVAAVVVVRELRR